MRSRWREANVSVRPAATPDGGSPMGIRRVDAIARQKVFHEAEAGEDEARPYREAEIQAHPGNFVLPAIDIMGHDPTGRHVVQAAEKSEKFLPGRRLGVPAARYIGTSTVAMKATYPARPGYRGRGWRIERGRGTWSGVATGSMRYRKAAVYSEFSSTLPR